MPPESLVLIKRAVLTKPSCIQACYQHVYKLRNYSNKDKSVLVSLTFLCTSTVAAC